MLCRVVLILLITSLLTRIHTHPVAEEESSPSSFSSKVDNLGLTDYRILDCTTRQKEEIAVALSAVRSLVVPAIAELANSSAPPSVTPRFEVLFGTRTYLREKVLDILQKIRDLTPIKVQAPWILGANPPTFFCANKGGPARKELGSQVAFDICQREGERYGGKQPLALTFEHLGGIAFCQPFFEQSPDHWPDEPDWSWPNFCPNVISRNRWGVRDYRIVNTQKSTVLHELVHFYVPCGFTDFTLDRFMKRPPEVYTLNDCTMASESLRARNPENYAYYVGMVEQNCTDLVDVYAPPWNRTRTALREGGLGVEVGNETMASLNASSGALCPINEPTVDPTWNWILAQQDLVEDNEDYFKAPGQVAAAVNTTHEA